MGLRDLVDKYAEGKGNFDNWSWFSLKDDGDTALVRLLINNIDDIEEFTHEVHTIKIGNWHKRVKCLGKNCPMCASGDNPSLRVWIPLIVKEGNTERGEKQVWERGLTDIKNLISLYDEYGDLGARDWKIKRNGKKGSTDTFYSFFPKDKEEMDELPDKPDVVGEKSFFCMSMNEEQMRKAMKGEYNPFNDKDDDSSGDTGVF
jgi:hypothetical protein